MSRTGDSSDPRHFLVLVGHPGPRFPLGQVVATPNALSHVPNDEIIAALRRHVSGDWGELDAHDKQVNEQALREGERLLSAYQSSTRVRFWIITEADRRVTTILLPEDY